MKYILTGFCISMTAALYMTFIWVPGEQSMGMIQRIFYFHVPSAWIAMMAFTLVFVGSVMYLVKRNEYWDWFAGSSAEIGMLFCTIVLVTGPLWAKPVWGIWWTWDARLTLTFVMWLIYAGYWIIRRQFSDSEKRARFSSVIGIIAFLDIPMVYFSIHWWRTQHPSSVFAGGEQSGLDGPMLATLLVSLTAFILLFILILHIRIRIEKIHAESERSFAVIGRIKHRTVI